MTKLNNQIRTSKGQLDPRKCPFLRLHNPSQLCLSYCSLAEFLSSQFLIYFEVVKG